MGMSGRQPHMKWGELRGFPLGSPISLRGLMCNSVMRIVESENKFYLGERCVCVWGGLKRTLASDL